MISGTMELQATTQAEHFIAYMKSFCVEHRCSNTINIKGMKFVFTYLSNQYNDISPYVRIKDTTISNEQAEEIFLKAIGE